MGLYSINDLLEVNRKKVGHSFHYGERKKGLLGHLSTSLHVNLPHSKIRISQQMPINPMAHKEEKREKEKSKSHSKRLLYHPLKFFSPFFPSSYFRSEKLSIS
jgi:hypothetical protein